MALVAGAAQHLNEATLSLTGRAGAARTTLLDNLGASSTSVLSIGRQASPTGFGLSSSARALNESLLNPAAFNELLSLAAGTDSSVEGATTQIAGLRSQVPFSKLAPSIQQQIAEDIVSRTSSVDEEV